MKMTFRFAFCRILCYNYSGDFMISFKWNGFDFTLVHFGKGVFNADMAGHSHAKNIYELHYIVDGKGALTTDTKTYSLSRGDFFVTGPNVYHRQSTDVNEPLTEIYFYLQASDKKSSDALVSSFLSTHFYFSREPELEDYFTQSVTEWDNKAFGYKSIIGATMEILLTKITRLYVPEFSDMPDNDDTLNDRRFLIIEHAFITNPAITLAELSEHIGLCERQTQRLLMKYYGKTFREKKKESNR